MSKFVHLHTHSHYSLLDGLGKVPDLISHAKALGMESLALTDHGVMYGVIEFYKECKNKGLKPIIGAETYLAPRRMEDKVTKIDTKPYHLVLLVKNKTGYQNLVKIISQAHLVGHYYKPRVDKVLLKKYADGLIAMSACFFGEIPQLAANKNLAKAAEAIKQYQDIFGRDNFYLELQDHPEIPEQKIVNQGLIELSKKTGAELVATADIHYIHPEDREAHEVLLAVQTGKNLDDENRMSLKEANLSMRSPEEMAQAFKDVPEAISNTLKIAEKCDLNLEFGKPILPEFNKPEGETSKSYLEKKIKEGLKQRFKKVTPEIQQRIDYELQVIEKTHFEDYFLIVADYVNFAKTHKIMVGPGRGSAAGSLVSYCLNITDLNPLEYDLLFERFLNPERIAPPDIDLDFADKRRDEVIKYISQKYGTDRVAQIITFGTMASRGSVRDTGRALGMAYSDVDKIAKLIPFGLTLEQTMSTTSELQDLYKKDAGVKKLMDMARKLEGVARHASTHAAGLVIAKDSLTNYVPLQYSPRGLQEVITQYAMNDLEAIGLIKMDLLGLANLTILENAIRIIRKTKNQEIDLSTLPIDDPETYALLSRAESTGVFQLECLSGETIVSNTTIKKLCERRNKEKLQSVYLDEGKVHKNQIINVLKGKEKDLYTLITENNWYIKASKDHYFLTKNGWKKMEDIQIGEEVLLKEHAKHLVFNTCELCKKQIDGQKEGKSKFCYRCSASFYKNPKKEISREKIRKARMRFYQDGGKPWNYGLTAETNNILRKTSQKISLALAGRSLEDLWGKEKAEKFKKAHSERNKGANNPMFGKTPPHRKGGFRNDLGHYVRSSWEADFARILRLHHINYQYEPKTFRLVKTDGEVLNYTPDFYIPSQHTFYEIKGWLHEQDAEKIKLFQEQYPHTNLVLINTTKFAEFALKYKTLVKWECPRTPVKQSFKFIKVRGKKYSGREQTYDIAMKSPGNNFVANGFLVHNSDGMKRYLKELRPSVFEDIIAMVALYRPGPIKLIPDYISGKRGKRKITYLHPKLEPILKNTYGIAVYQEQVLQIARDIAGFSLGEADILRKAIGKKIKKLLMEQQQKFVEDAKKNGVAASVAEKLFHFIEPFAEYGFNRAHAACYAMIAYQTAYLKAHFPSEFLAALMTSEQNNLDKLSIAINEAERIKIKVLPPDVNESFEEFGIVKDTGNIRFGLAAIKNVGFGAAEAIVEERKVSGPYQSFEDFLKRLGNQVLNKKIIESLAKAGALDNFAERNQILMNIEIILKFIGHKTAVSDSQMGLFGKAAMAENLTLKMAPIEPAAKKQKLSWEKELLGMYVSEHPLKGMEKILQKYAKPINEISSQDGRQVKAVGIITSISKITTRSKEPMLFAGLEDTTARTEILVFPKILKKDSAIWRAENIVLVEGRTNTKDGVLKIIAESVEEINLNPETQKQMIITLDKDAKKNILEQIKTILQEFPGELPVFLKIPQNGSYQEIKTKTKAANDPNLIRKLSDLLGQDSVEI